LVPGDADPKTALAKGPQAVRNVPIKVGWLKLVRDARFAAFLSRHLQIEAGLEYLERPVMVLATFDGPAKCRKEDRLWNLQPIRPGSPLAAFVYQRLADVEDDSLHRYFPIR